MSKPIKILLVTLLLIIVVAALVVAAAFGVLAIKSNAIHDDWTSVYSDEAYAQAVFVDGLEPIVQDVSCGYAVIEMFSSWNGDDISEESLYAQYGRVVTSTGKSFCSEFNKQFPEYDTKMYKYLKNSELIAKVYDSLSRGIPVPFEWAALSVNEWTLHYSIVIGMDVANDTVTVANPYGCTEQLSLYDFLDRTSFDAFVNMPLFYRLGFAFGVFEKNTVFIVS